MWKFSELDEPRLFEQVKRANVGVFNLRDESIFLEKMGSELNHQHNAFKGEAFISTAFICYHDINLSFVLFDIFMEEKVYVSALLSSFFIYYYESEFRRIQEPTCLVFFLFLQS
jgi:hypothetical protein